MPKPITASDLGRLGGSAGTGKAKRRSKDHYAKLAALNKERARKAKEFRASLGIAT